MGDGGKGSSPKPYSVSQEQFADNWEKIFGKKKKTDDKEDDNPLVEDQFDHTKDSTEK